MADELWPKGTLRMHVDYPGAGQPLIYREGEERPQPGPLTISPDVATVLREAAADSRAVYAYDLLDLLLNVAPAMQPERLRHVLWATDMRVPAG